MIALFYINKTNYNNKINIAIIYNTYQNIDIRVICCTYK